MKIIFTQQSLTHHTLEIMRSDTSSESVLLETKTFMPHDLIHYAYEREAGLNNSFWGMLAQGAKFDDFATKEKVAEVLQNNPEGRETEMITGVLYGYIQTSASEISTLGSLGNMFSAIGAPVPTHITPEFLLRFKETFRKVWGHWNSLSKDEPMTVEFP